ncbi:MAG: hypothetical protein LBN02_08115 [Oscillospiraceae bacterium]|jgi:hypothetical protein|nr:hypothetical protein [Oscillospiraceae bacterium]
MNIQTQNHANSDKKPKIGHVIAAGFSMLAAVAAKLFWELARHILGEGGHD